MRLADCYNFNDFRLLAKKRLPSPIFNYIDGAADDEITYARNTSSFNDVDLVPNVLSGVENVSCTIVRTEKNFMPYQLILLLKILLGPWCDLSQQSDNV